MCNARGANEALRAVLFPGEGPFSTLSSPAQAGVIDCAGVVSIMRRLLCVCLLLSLGACALFEPSGQRYIVFFRGSSAQMEDAAEAVLVGAADWAKKHPDMPVTVAGYADPYGSEISRR